MTKLKFGRKRITFLVFVLLFTTTCFAQENGLTITTWTDAGGDSFVVKNLSGDRLKENCKLQFLTSIAPPDPNDKVNLLHDPNSLFFEGAVGNQNTGVQLDPKNGEFDYYFKETPGTYYVRVWDTSTPQKGSNYNQSSVSVDAPPSPPVTLSVKLNTIYKADIPPPPSVKENNDYALAYDSTTKTYLPKFSLSTIKNKFSDGSDCEIVNYVIQVRRDGDAWSSPTVKVYNSGTANIQETDPVNPYFVSGQKYWARAAASNYFGTSDWGKEISFTIPASGGGAGPFEVGYNLKKVPGGLGVNSIGIPFDAPITFVASDGTESTINTLQELVDKIGRGKVTAASYWDEENQNLLGVTYDEKGEIAYSTPGFDPKTWNIKAGRGYYISVTENVSFKLKK